MASLAVRSQIGRQARPFPLGTGQPQLRRDMRKLFTIMGLASVFALLAAFVAPAANAAPVIHWKNSVTPVVEQSAADAGKAPSFKGAYDGQLVLVKSTLKAEGPSRQTIPDGQVKRTGEFDNPDGGNWDVNFWWYWDANEHAGYRTWVPKTVEVLLPGFPTQCAGFARLDADYFRNTTLTQRIGGPYRIQDFTTGTYGYEWDNPRVNAKLTLAQTTGCPDRGQVMHTTNYGMGRPY